MGSDFRPLATEIGKLRDYHSMGTIVPDGIMLVGEVAQGAVAEGAAACY